ncbi:MAG: hypothetical protein KC493_08485 [Bacteriovoracaceae bacterium]|nr:hypothetical protein [Bacteriovoracaceae bacterium]
MKNLLVIAAMTMSFNVLANDVETAQNLFANRGENVANAQEAADIYGALAAAATENGVKADLYYRQSEATYYVGTIASDDDDKEDIHEAGYKQAEKAIALVDGTDDMDEEETLAKAQFFYGANLGKYGEAKGIIASLSRVPELKKAMQVIIDLGLEDVEQYGANRILGRLYFKLPGFAGGDKKKSEKLLAAAVENTLNDEGTVSVHGLNNLYYAEVLKKNKKKAQACKILKAFSAQDGTTLLDTRIPETTKEIEEAKEMAKDFKC